MRAPLARIGSPRKAIWLPAVILFVFATACGPRTALTGHADDAKSKAEEFRSAGKDPLMVTVFPDGKVYPKKLVIKREVHAIVWYTADPNAALTLSPSATQTHKAFPGTITCPEAGAKGYCFADAVPAETAYDVYSYSGTAGGKKVDPEIEIVN